MAGGGKSPGKHHFWTENGYTSPMKERVAVLVSGGVDSAVALNLLARDGRHDPVAFYLKI